MKVNIIDKMNRRMKNQLTNKYVIENEIYHFWELSDLVLVSHKKTIFGFKNFFDWRGLNNQGKGCNWSKTLS